MDLVTRVKAILLTPKLEWPVIEQEQTTPAQLYTGYVIPLAAIGPIASVIGYSVFGIGVPLVGTVRVGLMRGITHGIVQYVLALVAVYVGAFIFNALAPTFGGKQDMSQALKLSVYASTASWVAGIFAILPGLAILSFLGLYSVYLLYTGVPVMMKSPPEKSMGYTIAAIVCWIVLFFIVAQVSRSFVAYY
ncbi:MAG: Yip1 family protein [Gemmatimonadota bacterium]